MATLELTTPVPDPPRPRPEWRDLILYFVVGVGGFVLASFVLGRFIHEVTLETSVLLYAINIVFFAGSVYLVGERRGKLSFAEIGFIPPRLGWSWFVRAFVFSLVLLPIRGLIGTVVQNVVGGGMGSLQQRMSIFAPEGFTWAGFLITLIGAGLLVPIAEELFFRGAIFTWFRQRYNFPIALIVSSTLFGLGHFDSAGVVASSFVLGLANGYMFEKSKTLWAPIVMHMTTNSIAVILVYALLAFAPAALRAQ